MGRAYLFNKDSCVWPQRQSKTKQNQPLLLEISRKKLTATGGGEGTGPRAKGCGRPLLIFSGFQDENKGQRGITTHFTSAPNAIQHLDLKRQLFWPGDGSKKCHQLQKN